MNIQVPRAIVHTSQFVNYVYGSSSDRYNMLTIGPGSIYNHHDERSVYYTWTDNNVINPSISRSAHANMTGVTFRTSVEVTTGQEMFNYYGADWFQRFTTDQTNPTSQVNPYLTAVQIEDLERAGHCLTDVIVGMSTVPGAGRGVFAARRFARGEVVTVSPALALRKATIAHTRRTSTLENYCLGTAGSDLLFFPISYGALINHGSPANVELGWYDWSAAEAIAREKYHRTTTATSSATDAASEPRIPSLQEKLAMTPSELTEAHFAQLDLAYTATRDIAKGEELFLDYGATWQQAWSDHTEALSRWEETLSITINDGGSASDVHALKRPQFRHTIQMPSDLYSPHWFQEEV